MNRLIASAIAVIISAAQVGACSNVGVKPYLHDCVSCGRGWMLINVCSSTVRGKCEEFHDQKLYGDCYIGEAGRCLSASSGGRTAGISNDLLADATTSSSHQLFRKPNT